MKNFFAKIIAVWALIIFSGTIIIVAFFIWIIGIFREPLRTKIFREISKIWIRTFFFLTGCGLKVIGKKNFKAGEKYIVTCNHNSLMDVPVVTPFIPGANKTIGKSSMAKIPLFGLVYKRGSVLVNRNDKNSRKDSYRKMKHVLEMGMHMCIYPEGTRNRTEFPLKEFHDGAFKLAVETGTAIIPALIFHTKKVLPPGKTFYFWPAQMELHFLPPVPVNAECDYKLLSKQIFNIMSHYYQEHI